MKIYGKCGRKINFCTILFKITNQIKSNLGRAKLFDVSHKISEIRTCLYFVNLVVTVERLLYAFEKITKISN